MSFLHQIVELMQKELQIKDNQLQEAMPIAGSGIIGFDNNMLQKENL
jgi:hypothetical protein